MSYLSIVNVAHGVWKGQVEYVDRSHLHWIVLGSTPADFRDGPDQGLHPDTSAPSRRSDADGGRALH